MDDFMDFNAWRDLASASEQEMLQQQLQQANAADTSTQQALSRAYQQSSAGGGQGLSQAGSYSDYLKAKQNSDKAWAAINAGFARSDSTLHGGVRTDARGQQADFAQREQALGGRLDEQHAAALKQKEANAQRAAAEKQAQDERDAATQDAQQRYLSALVGGAKGRAGAGGAQRDYFGTYNPYADSLWAQQQGGAEAAKARSLGASEEQVRSIWQSYTGKGRFGQGPNSRQNMEREINPWMKK